MDYVPAQEIVDLVLLEMSSYFDANMIDESLLYSEIASCMQWMGAKVLPTKKTTIMIDNYTGNLPDDFKSLDMALACTAYEFKITNNNAIGSYERTIVEIPACKTACDYCRDECGNLYEINLQFEQHKYKVQDLYPLVVSTTSEGCDLDCMNPVSDFYDITILNNQMHTQFENGTVYIEYKSKLVTESEILVPDTYEVKEWLKFQLHYVIFRKLYRNGDANVERRYQESKQEADMWKGMVWTRWKQKGFDDFMKLRSFLIRDFKRMTTNGIQNSLLRYNRTRTY